MGRPPRSREPIKAAALALFVERGVHATGIRDIARAANCSEAALYRHWGNKDALVSALFREHLHEVVTILEDSLNGPGSARDQLLAACTALYQLYDEQPFVFRFTLLVQHELGPYLSDDVIMPHAVIAAYVSRIQAPVDNPTRCTLTTAALIGICVECASRVIYGHLPGPLVSYAATVADLCWNTIVPSPQHAEHNGHGQHEGTGDKHR